MFFRPPFTKMVVYQLAEGLQSGALLYPYVYIITAWYTLSVPDRSGNML